MREMYQGRRRADGSCEILADGKPLPLGPSLKVWNHSPTGFEWGYRGSGPAQSALAVLLDFTGRRDFAERNHQHFKEWYFANAPKKGWFLPARILHNFISARRMEEAALGNPLCSLCLCPMAIHSVAGRCWSKGCKCGAKKKV